MIANNDFFTSQKTGLSKRTFPVQRMVDSCDNWKLLNIKDF